VPQQIGELAHEIAGDAAGFLQRQWARELFLANGS
jgi:hypothetical protein